MLIHPSWFFILVLSIFFTACIKDNSPSIPAYIHIENIFFEADTSLGQGSSSSAITDAWPSVDGQLLGANNLYLLDDVRNIVHTLEVTLICYILSGISHIG